jgi:hypothetical protein
MHLRLAEPIDHGQALSVDHASALLGAIVRATRGFQ